MATIDATAGGASANSFVTEAEAIAYAADRLNLPSGWATVSGADLAEDEKKALIAATQDVDRLTFQGYRTTTTQALSWPRSYVVDPDASISAVVDQLERLPYYDDDVVPTRLKEAVIELAFEHLRANITIQDANVGVIRKRVDVLETEWQPGARAVGLSRFPRVMDRLRPLLGPAGLQVARS